MKKSEIETAVTKANELLCSLEKITDGFQSNEGLRLVNTSILKGTFGQVIEAVEAQQGGTKQRTRGPNKVKPEATTETKTPTATEKPYRAGSAVELSEKEAPPVKTKGKTIPTKKAVAETLENSKAEETEEEEGDLIATADENEEEQLDLEKEAKKKTIKKTQNGNLFAQ